MLLRCLLGLSGVGVSVSSYFQHNLTLGGVPISRPCWWRRAPVLAGQTRARADGGQGACPAGAAAGEERPLAARAPNGPGWGREVNCCSQRELGGDTESSVPRVARGKRRRQPTRSRREAPSAALLSQHVADSAAPRPARRRPRAAATGAALTRYEPGGAQNSVAGVRERERLSAVRAGRAEPRGHPWP